MSLFSWLRNRFNQIFRKPYFRKIRAVDRVSSIPDDLQNNEAYIVEKAGRKVWLVLNCPCPDHHRLTINLSHNSRPSWDVDTATGYLSVYPSLWLKDGCNSHFWIRDGDVRMVSDD